MEVSAQLIGPATVLTPRGELDASSVEDLRAELAPLVPEQGKVVVDLTGVPYMSSAGLRMMLLLYRQAKCVQSDIAIVGLSDDLRDIMDATGFLSFFTVRESVESGIAALP